MEIYYKGHYGEIDTTCSKLTQMKLRKNQYTIELIKVDPSDELVFYLVNKITQEIVEKTRMNLKEIIIGKMIYRQQQAFS